MPLKQYLYLTAIPDSDAEIINAECLALAESAPNRYGIAISSKRVDVSRGAYMRSCTELLFEGGAFRKSAPKYEPWACMPRIFECPS